MLYYENGNVIPGLGLLHRTCGHLNEWTTPVTDRRSSGFIDPTKQGFARFRELDRPGPVHMLNLLKFRDKAAYDDGTIATGFEAYRSYARESGPIFERLGGRQVWAGRPELTLIGPQEETWDLAFIAEYPSKDAFVAMLRDPDYRKAVRHRQAAVADSRLIRMQPGVPGAGFGEMSLDLPGEKTGMP